MSALSPKTVSSVRYRVVHHTRYTYQSLVTLSQQYLHLSPRTLQYQKAESPHIWVTPAEEDGANGIDYFGNGVRHITITTPHKMLLVHAEFTVTLAPRHGPGQVKGTLPWESLRNMLQQVNTPALQEACRYLYASPHVDLSAELESYARASYTPGRSLLDAALDLTQRIFRDFEFDPHATDISTPLDQVLKGRRGVCQDFTHLMIGCLRSIGLPARYVSGYILTHPPAGQPRMIGADASHAWVSVFCPSLGWVDFDPTNRCLVQQEHITLGWGRDFSDVTPLRGVVLGGGENELQVNVTVTPLPLQAGRIAA
ncbi:MAG: transglutaminase family protein [Polaromonas sp.]